MIPTTTRAVALARGLGRMRAGDDPVLLAGPASAADAGAARRSSRPTAGRFDPLSALADAGLTDCGAVIALMTRRRRDTTRPPVRVRLSYVVQDAPLGHG